MSHFRGWCSSGWSQIEFIQSQLWILKFKVLLNTIAKLCYPRHIKQNHFKLTKEIILYWIFGFIINNKKKLIWNCFSCVLKILHSKMYIYSSLNSNYPQRYVVTKLKSKCDANDICDLIFHKICLIFMS